MLNSKVIDLLKSFSREEIKKFSEFLSSPFHNKNKKALQLFNLLTKYHPGYDSKNLAKEKLFRKIFSEGSSQIKYNDASVRNLLSDLMISAEKFLAYLNFENDKFYFNERISRELCNRKLSAAFEKRIKKLEDLLLKKEFEGEEEYYRKFIFEELKSSSVQFSDNLKLYKDDSNTKASEYLSCFYLIKVFKMINFFAFQKQYNINQSSNIAYKIIKELNIDNVIEDVKNKSDRNFLILLVYFRMYKSLDNPSDDRFYFEFKKILLENDKLFSQLEKYGLYVCLANSCVQKIDMGNENFFKECFEVNKIICDKNLHAAYPGYFPLTAFISFLNTGVAANELDKVEEFINKYSIRLNPEHKEDALNYALAQLNFYRGNFDNALEFVSKTETEFLQFKFLLKILSLKIYYELEDYESLYYTADSFLHFINKHKIVGESYKVEFNNFIRILDLIVKYKTTKEEKHLFKIKKGLENKSIASKRWLNEKLSQINK